MENRCKENRNVLSHSQTSCKVIPNPQSMLSHKSLTILFSALFLFFCWGSPRFPVRVRCQKILQKVHLPCTKLLYADLLGTCCNILEKSIATLCLSFPIGCMAIKTHNYLCKPACVGVTYILLKPVGVRTSQGVSQWCCWCTLGYLTCRHLT